MRTRRAIRCERCHQSLEACMCDLLVPIAVRTRLQVLVHHVEAHKTTNTGRMAALTLGGTFEIWGDARFPAPVMPEGPVLLLFPSAEAEPLRAEHAEGSPTLVVPDGNWPQARKIARRLERARSDVTRVSLSELTSSYPFRRTKREGAVSTFEAIAHAMALLEGGEGPRVLAEALALFEKFVERQSRASRGGAHVG